MYSFKKNFTASKVTIDVESNSRPPISHQMDLMFKKEYQAARKIMLDDMKNRSRYSFFEDDQAQT